MKKANFKMEKGIWVISNLTLLVILLFSGQAHSAIRYVTENGSGNMSGIDWSNSYSGMPSLLQRGDTYYLADGSYGAYTFADQVSGATFIFIKKATLTDHGTQVGWQNSMGDSAAVFSNLRFTSDYYDIDGQVGQWASDMPGYVAHGIQVETNSTSNNTKIVRMGGSGTRVTNINLKHLELSYTNTPISGSWGENMDVLWGYGSDWLVSYCWLHDAGRAIALFVGTDNVIVEYSVLERNGQGQVAMGWSPSEHSEISMMQPDADNITWRYNYIRDYRSTGGLVLYDGNDNIEIHGNIFWDTGYWSIPSQANDSNGIITGLGAGTYGDVHVYNNTFYAWRYGCNVLNNGTWNGDREVFNNIFYSCRIYANGANLGASISGPHDYNWFYDSGTQSETHIQNGSADIFSDPKIFGFSPSVSTQAGVTLGSQYSFDIFGNSRDLDGVWDRGAITFDIGGFDSPPNPPTGLRMGP